MKRSKKKKRWLYSRQQDWEQLMKSRGNTVQKHPKGFRRPGSNSK